MNPLILAVLAFVAATPKKAKRKPAPVVQEQPAPAPEEPSVGAYKYQPEPEVKVAKPAPAPIPDAPDRRRQSGVFLGAHLRAAGVFPGPIVMKLQPGIEVGYRLPQTGGYLGVSATVSYVFGLADPTGSAHGVSGSVLALLFVPVGPGLVRVAFGPTVSWLQLTTPLASGSKRTDSTGSVGLEAAAGYYFLVPVGLLGVSFTYALSPYISGRATSLSNAIGGEVAYAYFF